MPQGYVTALYLFDVAELVDLDRLADLLRGSERAPFAPKPAAPPYVAYDAPPRQLDASVVGLGQVDGWQARFKVFDYGVISVAFTRAMAGDWDALVAESSQLLASATLEEQGERYCRALVQRIHDALVQPRERFLAEDYFVFAVTDAGEVRSADALIAAHGDAIAQLLRGEREPLSRQERDEVLRQRLSYFASDLVIPTWSAAFVYDTEAGVQAALEILEFANSQLLQFRYYDELLDGRLEGIYKELETSRDYRSWMPRRYTRAAREVHALFIDVNELTDRTENALKLVGDIYAARLLALVHARLGVTAWRDSVQDKLRTLDAIYRFAVDQTAMDRGEVLELAIVGILVFELVLFFMGIMR